MRNTNKPELFQTPKGDPEQQAYLMSFQQNYNNQTSGGVFETPSAQHQSLLPPSILGPQYDTNCLIDWINSFDDPFCVIVSQLPQDLLNGVVLSHLVGYIACSTSDREKIFDLLCYPEQDFGLKPQQIAENFDLAYNVLKFSQLYQSNENLQFLDQGGAQEAITPQTLASGGRGGHLMRFVQGLQTLAFCQRQQPAGASGANQAAGAPQQDTSMMKSYEAPFSQSMVGNQSGLQQKDQVENRVISLTDYQQKNQQRVQFKETEELVQVAQSEESEDEELKRLEAEEKALMDELNCVDMAVKHVKEEYTASNDAGIGAQRYSSQKQQQQYQTMAQDSQRYIERPPIRPSTPTGPSQPQKGSYRMSSERRLKAYHESLVRPLAHKQRRNQLQKKMLQQMDYANVIRRSYSRGRNARTTDQVVVEGTANIESNFQTFQADQWQHGESVNLDNHQQPNVRQYHRANAQHSPGNRSNASRSPNRYGTYRQGAPQEFAQAPEGLSARSGRPTIQHERASYSQQKRQQSNSQRRQPRAGSVASASSEKENGHSPKFRLGNSGRFSAINRKQQPPSPKKQVTIQDELQRPSQMDGPEGFKDLKLSEIVKDQSNIKVGHVCCHQKRGRKGNFECETCNQQLVVVQSLKSTKSNKRKRSLRSSLGSRSNYNADLNDDDVMSEMQTLNVRKEKHDTEIKDFINQEKLAASVQVIDEALKRRILDWLSNGVRLLKPMSNVDPLIVNFPQFCRTGVIFGDLVNRVNGRNEVIKGIHRNPPKGNTSQIQANFSKVMDHFKEYPRFCSRYLWSQNEMIQGNEDIIWGFLDDIWYWAHQKISPYDPAGKQHKQKIPPSKSNLNQNLFTLRTTQQAQLHPKKPPLCNPLLLPGARHHNQSSDHFTVPKQTQNELLKPRTILPPSNIVVQKRCMSARNNFNPFSSAQTNTRQSDNKMLASWDSQFDDSVFQTSIMSRRKSSNSPKSKSPPRKQTGKRGGKQSKNKAPIWHQKSQQQQNEDMQLELDSFGLFQETAGDHHRSSERKAAKENFMKGSQQSMTHHFQHLMREDIVPVETEEADEKKPKARPATQNSNECRIRNSLSSQASKRQTLAKHQNKDLTYDVEEFSLFR